MAVESNREVKHFLSQVAGEQAIDLGAWEAGLRAAVLAAGATALEQMLSGIGTGRRKEPVLCACGMRMQSVGIRPKQVLTILGPVTLKRSWFVCPKCACGRSWADEALSISQTGFSPGLRRLMARAGSRETFKNGAEDLKEYAGITVSAKDVERVAEKTGEAIGCWQQEERDRILRAAQETSSISERTVGHESVPVLYVSYDGTGIPMVPREVAGRRGKQADGSAKTREVKLGCVFTQTTTGYFTTNQERMRYAQFRAQGLFVGSGVIEAGCKTIIGMRLKQSGMEWTVRDANSIIALRCCSLSNRIEEFWEQRVA